jgi:hypothetical protein
VGGEHVQLEIERVALDYSLLGLLRGRVREAAVDGVRLRGRAADGRVSFAALSALRGEPAEASGSALVLPPIDSLVLDDAQVELATAEGTLQLRVDGELALGEGLPAGSLAIRALRSQSASPILVALDLAPEGAAGGEIPIALEISAPKGAALRGSGRLRLDPPAAEIDLTGALAFTGDGLQPADLAPELGAWLAAARGALAVRASLRASADGIAVSGRVETEGVDLATPGGIAVLGLAGGADLEGPPWLRTRRPSTLRFRRADVIGPFEDGTVRFALRGPELEVEEAIWGYAGGRLTTAGRFDLRAAEHPFAVEVADVSLARLLDQVALPGLSGSGSLSGRLPLVFDGERFRVREGSLAAAPPGGVVRYAPAAAAEGGLGLGEDLDVLAGALEDFHYDTLRLDLSGSLDGEVRVGITLHGKNPRYQGGRRVELNAKLETDLPALLRASRSVTGVPEVIERRLRGRVTSDGS